MCVHITFAIYMHRSIGHLQRLPDGYITVQAVGRQAVHQKYDAYVSQLVPDRVCTIVSV